MTVRRLGLVAAVCSGAAAMSCADSARCGPEQAEVARVLDGDTIELVGGQLVRYLMVDAPELGEHACFSEAAAQANRDLVLGKVIELRDDQQCDDAYGRRLAYVSVGGRDVSRLLVERGYACVLHLPPNGDDRLDEFLALAASARAHRRGLWAACSSNPCR